MAVWRTLLRLSAYLHDVGDVQTIDATGFDRHSASRHYANRTDYTFRSVKTTAFIDCETSTVLDIHCSMKQPHDTQIGQQVLTRNLNRLQTVTADKGYDWDDCVKNFGRLTFGHLLNTASFIRLIWHIMLIIMTPSITDDQ